jgi:hypothetical protein
MEGEIIEAVSVMVLAYVVEMEGLLVLGSRILCSEILVEVDRLMVEIKVV